MTTTADHEAPARPETTLNVAARDLGTEVEAFMRGAACPTALEQQVAGIIAGVNTDHASGPAFILMQAWLEADRRAQAAASASTAADERVAEVTGHAFAALQAHLRRRLGE